MRVQRKRQKFHPKGSRLRWKLVRWEPGLSTIEFIDVFEFNKIYHGCELWRITRIMYIYRTNKIIRKTFWSIPIPLENAERGWCYTDSLKQASTRAFSNFIEEKEEAERQREYDEAFS